VLGPGGRLYASTVGRAHLREIDELAERIWPDAGRLAALTETVEKGLALRGAIRATKDEGIFEAVRGER
jgi:hypothetical protein